MKDSLPGLPGLPCRKCFVKDPRNVYFLRRCARRRSIHYLHCFSLDRTFSSGSCRLTRWTGKRVTVTWVPFTPGWFEWGVIWGSQNSIPRGGFKYLFCIFQTGWNHPTRIWHAIIWYHPMSFTFLIYHNLPFQDVPRRKLTTSLFHRIHVWYIYLHEWWIFNDFHGKCR